MSKVIISTCLASSPARKVSRQRGRWCAVSLKPSSRDYGDSYGILHYHLDTIGKFGLQHKTALVVRQIRDFSHAHPQSPATFIKYLCSPYAFCYYKPFWSHFISFIKTAKFIYFSSVFSERNNWIGMKIALGKVLPTPCAIKNNFNSVMF